MSTLLQAESDFATSSLNIIRIETALSRFPVHHLAKKGICDIEITRCDERGQVQLLWEVSYNRKYGPPRQLAYRLDTLIINRRIEEAGRPLPRLLRLGTLNEIGRELGSQKHELKRAFQQNATAAINAKLSYKTSGGEEQSVEAIFNRYNVIFTGQKLPDGGRADAVYLSFSDTFWEVLSNAVTRPLDYDYLKQLTPAAQRCYEIISYKLFGALVNRRTEAKISYSDYCAYSAQQRYFDYEHVKKQMYKVHVPHLRSGYLSGVRFEQSVDEQGRVDWQIVYTPGSRARAEFRRFTRKSGKAHDISQSEDFRRVAEMIPQAEVEAEADGYSANQELIEALTARGVTEEKAKHLLASVPPDQSVNENIAWGDHLIREAQPGAYRNPAGFFVHLIRSNIVPPPIFAGAFAERTVAADTPVRPTCELGQCGQQITNVGADEANLDSLIDALGDDEKRRLEAASRSAFFAAHPYATDWPQATLDHVLADALRSAVENHVRGARESPSVGADDSARRQTYA